MLALIAVFVGGLLVGRTPEYLGKKLGRREITLAALSILVMPALVLIGTAITVILGSTTGYQGNGGEIRVRRDRSTGSVRCFTPSPPPRTTTAAPSAV